MEDLIKRDASYHRVSVDGTPQAWWLVTNEMLGKRVGWWAAIDPMWVGGITLRWLTFPAAMLHDFLSRAHKRG